MSDDKTRLNELLQLHLDGRLSEQEQREIEELVKVDLEARARLAALRWSKEAAARHLRETEVPAGLEDRLRDLIKEDQAEEVLVEPKPGLRWWSLQRAALAAGLLLLLGLVGWWQFKTAEALPDLVMRDFDSLKQGRIELDIMTAETTQIEAMFTSRGVGFQTRVFDFGMMGYAALGGRVHRLQDRTSALFVYENEQGVTIVCQMYLGALKELPDFGRASVRDNDGIEFHVYEPDTGVVVQFEMSASIRYGIDPCLLDKFQNHEPHSHPSKDSEQYPQRHLHGGQTGGKQIPAAPAPPRQTYRCVVDWGSVEALSKSDIKSIQDAFGNG